jgi:hypothetical protein
MPIRFVVYIDEAGDPGVRSVKPINPAGASEWLILAGFLVRIENDRQCISWAREIIGKFRNAQSTILHFRNLLDVKKRIACEIVAQKPCRFFIVASNKKNIAGYRNLRIQDGNKNWLYWWLSRLLLERVTEFCEARAQRDGMRDARLRIIFSRRGRLRYSEFDKYFRRIRGQSYAGALHVSQGDLRWDLIDFEEVRVFDHDERAGLQLADIGASAFFQALERNRPADCIPDYAYLLKPVVARRNRWSKAFGFGLKTMPDTHMMGLSTQQQQIFEQFGYDREGWRAPGS